MEHGWSIGGGSSKSLWRSHSPTLAKNRLLSPLHSPPISIERVCKRGDKYALMIAEDKVAYKLGPEPKATEAGTEESLSDPVVLEPPPVVFILKPRTMVVPQPQHETRPSREPHWRDIDLSSFEYPETPFTQVQEVMTELLN